MNEQGTEDTTTARRLTDVALIVVAIVAIAAWLWRRIRGPASVDVTSGDSGTPNLSGNAGDSAEFPPNNAQV
jgi:hypothetical protein